jgi:ribosomal protein S18 acetylase RimI-like enzyme
MEGSIRPFVPADERHVVELWRQCELLRTWCDPRQDIARNQQSACGRLFVAVADDQAVATVMVGYDGRRGWINYLAVAPAHRRKGLGRAMMHAAEHYLLTLGCPKVNLQVRDSNQGVLAFYSALGYRDDRVISLGKRLDIASTTSA